MKPLVATLFIPAATALLGALGFPGALSLFEAAGIAGPNLLLYAVGIPLPSVFAGGAILCFGLWKGMRWARILLLTASSADIAISGLLLANGRYVVAPALLVNLAIGIYLIRRGPSSFFRPQSPGPHSRMEPGPLRYLSLPVMFLLTTSAFSPALQIPIGQATGGVAPAFAPGYSAVRLGPVTLAYRMVGLIPELRLEPTVSVEYGFGSAPAGRSTAPGAGAAAPAATGGQQPGNAAALPSSGFTSSSLAPLQPSSQPGSNQASCNDSLNYPYQAGAWARFDVYQQNPAVNQPYGCIFVNSLGPMAYDPNGGYIFTASRDFAPCSNPGVCSYWTVTALSDLSGDVVANVTVPKDEAQVVVGLCTDMLFDASNNLLYIIGGDQNETVIINAATLSYQGSVWIGNGPGYGHLVLDPTNGLLYITDDNTNTLLAIDTSTNTLVANITLSSTPYDAAYDPFSNRIFVDSTGAFGLGNVSVIDPATNQVVGNITLSNSLLNNIVYDSANHLLYVEDGDVSSPITLSVINGTSDQFVENVPLTSAYPGPGAGYNLFFNPGNDEIYDPLDSGGAGNTTLVYSPSTGAVQEIGVCEVNTFIGDDCGPVYVTYDSWNGVMYFSKGSGAIIAVPTVAAKLPREMRFTESGLPQGTVWNVTVEWAPQQGESGPTRRFTNTSNAPTDTFEIPAGNTYSYSVQNITMPCFASHCSGNLPAGYEPSPSAGSFFLGSGGDQVSVTYAMLFATYFDASGLPQNQRWSVTLSACASIPVGGGVANACSAGSRKSSSGGEITFLVQSGVGYSFNVSSTGYLAAPSVGSFTANQDKKVPVTFMLLTTGQGILTAFGDVFVVDPNDDSVVIYSQSPFLGIQGSVRVGSDPVALAAVTAGTYNLVLAVNQGSDSVTVIDPSTGTALDNISVGNRPVSIAVFEGQPVFPTGEAAAVVTDYGSDSLSVILFSPGTCTLVCVFTNVNAEVTNVQLADSPVGIAATTATAYGWAYVSLYNSRAVEIFRVSSYNSVVAMTGTGYLATGLNPMGVAIDQRDDVMVADAGSGGASEILPACSSCTPISPPDSKSQVLPVAFGSTATDASAFVGVASDETNTSFFMSGSDARGHDQLSVVSTGIYTGSYLGDYNLENPWAEIPGLTAPFQTNAVGVLNTTAALVAPMNGSLYLVPTFPVTFEVCGNVAVKSTTCISGFPAEMSINNATYAPPTAFPLTVYLPGGPNVPVAQSCAQNCYSFGTYGTYSYDFGFTAPSGYLVNGTTFSAGLYCELYSADSSAGYNEPCDQFNYMFASNYKAPPNVYPPILSIVGINGPATIMMNVSKIVTPDSWLDSPYFQISENTVSFKDIAAVAGALIGSAATAGATGGLAEAIGGLAGYVSASNSPRLEIDIYTVTQAPGVSFSTFNYSLWYYFNVTYPSGYSVSSVTITHIPLIRMLNSLLSLRIAENDSGIPWNILGMGLTVGGSLNMVSFNSTPESGAFSSCTSTDAICSWVSSLGGLAATLASVVVCLVKGKLCPSGGVTISKLVLSTLSAIGSIWSDFKSSTMLGSLYQKASSTEVFFDLISPTNLLKFAAAVVSVVAAIVKFVNDLIYVLSLVTFQVQNIPYIFSLIVDFFTSISQTASSYCALLTCSSSFKGFLSTANSVLSATSFVLSFVEVDDPNGSTVLPSYYYKNGTLALGYDPATGSFITKSSSGFILPDESGFDAYLNAAYNYTLTLNMVGPPSTNTTVPYTAWETEGGQTSTAVSGVLSNNSETSVSVATSANGTFVNQPYLEPAVSVSGALGSYTVNVKSVLSNGSTVAASRAYLTIDGTTYAMHQQNSTSFYYQVSRVSQQPTPFTVEVLGDGVPGGFAAAYLPTTGYSVTFEESGLSTGSSWAVTLNGTTKTSTSNSLQFAVPGNGTYSYSVPSVSGYTVSTASGTVTVNGANTQVAIAFTPGQSTMTTTTASQQPTSTTSNTSTAPSTTSGAPSQGFPLVYAVIGIAVVVLLVLGFVVTMRRKPTA